MSQKALIIVDIQNDYFEEGAFPLEGPIEASVNAGKVLDYFRAKNLPVVHIQHVNPEGAPFMVTGTHGVEIHKNVAPLEGEKIIIKAFPNSFRETELLNYLKENSVEEVVITGMMSHMCVDATARAAFDYGFKCTVIGDACASRDLEINGKTVKADDVHTAFLAALAFIYGEVKNTEQFLND